jgi:hypothetical protein
VDQFVRAQLKHMGGFLLREERPLPADLSTDPKDPEQAGRPSLANAAASARPWPPLALLVSGVAPPPSAREELLFYDALAYETPW